MRRLFLLLALLPAASPALAQREVYDPEPPRGSAYVRFVNAMPAEVEIRSDFAPGQRIGTENARRAGAYVVVEKVANRRLAVEIRSGGRSATATVSPPADGFMTILVHPGADGAPQVAGIAEEMNFNRARARLGFYNGVAGCSAASLRLHPDGPVIFTDVGPGQARNRSVNPVTADISATCMNRQAPPIKLEGLEAGQSHSVFLIARGDLLQLFLTRDVTTPPRR